MSRPFLVDVVLVSTGFVVLCVVFSLFFMYRRRKLEKQKLRSLFFTLPSELRKRHIPVIESTPFWVPGLIPDNVVDIEVQPSMERFCPRFSTPKPRRKDKSAFFTKPQLKFSVKYNTSRSTLLVDLLESKNLGNGNLVQNTSTGEAESFLSEMSVFSPIKLSSPGPKGGLPAVKRTRKNSYEFEMSYEDLQLQSLQFSVMAYDEYSRQKVIGDVILPMAEFTTQGLDVTRELVMWRDIQTMEKRSAAKLWKDESSKNVSEVMQSDDEPCPNDSRCSPS